MDRRRVEAVLGRTCAPDGPGPRVPPGGFLAHDEHAKAHTEYVDGCAGCLARRRESPFGGYGPDTGGPAFFWRDEAGRAGWEDGRPPVPCGEWYTPKGTP